MRLIDADKLKKAIQAVCGTDSITTVEYIIDEVPTAYDPDKIVEQLEECKTKKYVTGITHNPYELGACHAMDDAVEIVKGGAV